MRRSYLTFNFFIIITLIGIDYFSKIASTLPKNDLLTKSKISFKKDSESLLAQGTRLSLSQLDLYDLQLIPRISDKLSQNIYNSKSKIISKAKGLKPKHKYKALEIVKGIGNKTAYRLNDCLLLR